MSMAALTRRDLVRARRNSGAWLLAIIFFFAFISLFVIGFGGEKSQLKSAGPVVIWLAWLLSALLALEQFFSEDAKDDTINHWKLAGHSMISYVAARLFARWMILVLPLLLASAVGALILGLTASDAANLVSALLAASPAFLAYSGFTAAALTRGQGSLIMVILTVPLLAPVLILGLAATALGPASSAMLALLGLSLLASAFAIPAAAAALQSGLE